jgi:hypothetical protein
LVKLGLQSGVLLLGREQAFLQVVHALMVACDIFTVPNDSTVVLGE